LERRPSEREGAGEPARRQARAYQFAFEAVLAIPIAMGLGWFIDSRVGSAPAFLLVGLGLGFTTFIVGVVRMRRLVEEEAAAAERDEKRG
jgi:F0F1-type ATP synthase assembly protein I